MFNKIVLESTAAMPSIYGIQLYDAAGKILLQQNKLLGAGLNEITMPSGIASQVLLLVLQNKNGSRQNFKILKP